MHIHGASAVIDGQLKEQSCIKSNAGLITSISFDCTETPDSFHSGTLIPGFVDIHSHGGAGFYFSDLSPENVETEGELYIFKVPKSDIKNLVVSYGDYAHGTIKELGIITKDSINDELSIKEYSIRPTINDECWNALLEFRVPESDL
jgi:hypothetical protein